VTLKTTAQESIGETFRSKTAGGLKEYPKKKAEGRVKKGMNPNGLLFFS